MKITATPCRGMDLMPGDLFSTAPQSYWDTIASQYSIGERVYIRTDTPAESAPDLEATVYRITIAPTRAKSDAPDLEPVLVIAELVEALRVARNRLFVHQSATTEQVVAQCDAAIARALGERLDPPEVPLKAVPPEHQESLMHRAKRELAEGDERRLWIGTYGAPEHGGWDVDPSDGRRKPIAIIYRQR